MELLTRAIGARCHALRKMREELSSGAKKTAPHRPRSHVPTAVQAAMSVGVSAEMRMNTLAASARVFAKELFEAKFVLKELLDVLERQLVDVHPQMTVHRRDLEAKIAHVKHVYSTLCSGQSMKSMERKIVSFYMGMQQTIASCVYEQQRGASETSKTDALHPVPHSRRTQILSVALDNEGLRKLEDETKLQQLSAKIGTDEKAVTERMIAELGVLLGVQKHEVQTLETDSCVCGAPMLRSINKSLMVCSSPDCGRVKKIIETTASGPGVDDSDTGVANTRRSTSIKDFLHKWQAIDRVQIPIQTKRTIAKYIYNDLNVKDETQLTYRHVVCAVFELKLSRDLYDHISQLWTEFSGQPPPHLSYNESLIITSMWRIVQDSFSAISANHSKFFFFPLIVERFCRLMRFDAAVQYLVPVYTRASDATTFHAIQNIFNERGYTHIPPPHVYFLHNISSATQCVPMPVSKPTMFKSNARVRKADAVQALAAADSPVKRMRVFDEM